ncbi:MAG TPA: nitrous oxide-stimulated promoter family protein [Bacteroidetes bacterium]|nr:nitrous oxide-stimulated promoter family protein [Bacteroidota bacterium]
MFFLKNREEREIRTLKTMIRMYCKAKHHPEGYLCDSCAEVLSYAAMKYHRCMFGKNKPVCSVCPVHCYNHVMRKRIREIMRFSGPRMIFNHPVMAIEHLLVQRWSKKNMPLFLKRVRGKQKRNSNLKSA